MKVRHLALLAVIGIVSSPLFAAHLAKAGRWQTTIQLQMAGSDMKMPAHTIDTCVTKEQAENVENLIPKSGDKRGGCTYSDVTVSGNTVTWKMTCEKSGLTGTGSLTYQGDTYDGSMQMKMHDQAMSAKYSGKFVGACDGTELK